MKLTQKLANEYALPDGRDEIILFDDDIPGFGLRIGKMRKSWIVQWQQGERQRRMTIGHTGMMSAVKAREQVQTILARGRLGEDPQAEKFARRHTVRVGDLVDRFIEQKQARNRAPRTLIEMQRYLSVYTRPLHGQPADGIDRARIALFLDDLARSRSRNVTDACRRYLSSFFSWAMRQGYCEGNPVLLTERPVQPVIRDRLLSPLEIKAIWTATDDGSDFSRIVRLLMLTGQRRQEIAALSWSEIDLDKKLIRLPSGRTKNKRPHLVPLSDLALEIIHDTAQRPDSTFPFGAAGTPFSGFSRAKKALDRRIGEQTGDWHCSRPLAPA